MKHDGLVLHDKTTAVVGVVLCNEKSRNKTLERGELWIVDPDTRRVLPYRGGGVAVPGGFVAKRGWFEVTIAEPEADGTNAAEDNPSQPESDPATPAAAPATEDSAAAAPDTELSPATVALEPVLGPVLAELTATIAERRRTLPEGSYTTHLFTKGTDKIRKKTGEEAVELILARDDDELLSEAADLIYHLMVLLEAEGLALADVVAVLDRRHRSG